MFIKIYIIVYFVCIYEIWNKFKNLENLNYDKQSFGDIRTTFA